MTKGRPVASLYCAALESGPAYGAEAAISGGIERLYRDHWPLVYGYLLRRTADPHLAEDLAQDTYAKATRALLGWRGESPAGWLLSIARTVHLDHLRRSGRTVPLPDQAELLGADGHDGTTEVEVRAVLARLPVAHRRLLTLIYLHGYSLSEVAAMSGRNVGAVKTALWRARAAFAAAYGGPDE